MFKPLSIVACLAMMAALLVGPAEAQTAAEIDGIWRGERTGNETSHRLVPGGIEVRAVTANPDQTQTPAAFFRQVSPSDFRYRFPDGTEAVLEVVGRDLMRATNPDGWTDTFRRISAPPAATVATPPPPPPQRVLTAAEQERVRAAQLQLDSSQSSLDFCREWEIGAFCAELETQAAEDRQRLSQITAQPSRPLPPLADAQRRDRIRNELNNLANCRANAPTTAFYLPRSENPSASREERERIRLYNREVEEQFARNQQERERHFAACQPDMNAINEATASPPQAIAPAATTQTSTPAIADSWRASLAQSSDAFTQREHDLSGRSRRVHNGANDATDCIRVEVTGTRVEWGTEGRMRMVNTCSYPVAVTWCANTTDCERIYGGNLWTISAGRDWPIFFSDPENPDVRLGACRTGAQAVALPGPAGVYTDANINQRHLEPKAGSAAGARGWERNICE